MRYLKWIGLSFIIFVGVTWGGNAAVTLSSAGATSTVTAPATGAGNDTCTGNGCAIGPSGISTDGGILSTGVSGSVAFGVSTNGARIDHGAGASDYDSSDGTTVTFAGPLKTAASMVATTGYFLGAGTLLVGVGVPTLTGFCATTPSIVNANGTAAFTINVGTACSASTGTITLPVTATTGWVCTCYNVTAPASNVIGLTGGSATTCTITNYTRTTGVASNFTASDILRCSAMPY